MRTLKFPLVFLLIVVSGNLVAQTPDERKLQQKIDSVLARLEKQYSEVRLVTDMYVDDDKSKVEFIVRSGKLWGVVNGQNKVLIPVQFKGLYWMGWWGLYAGKLDKFGLVNDNNKRLTLFQYDSIFPGFSPTQVIVMKNKKLGLMDFDGKELTRITFTDLTRQSTYGCRCAKMNGKWGVIAASGKDLTGFLFEDLKRYDPMMDEIPLKKNGKWGFYDCENQKDLSLYIYDSVVSFSGYEATVMLNGLKKKVKLK